MQQYNRDARVQVQLKVKSLDCFPSSPSNYYVAVSGTGLQLGNDDPDIAPRCQPIGGNIWMKNIWPPKNSTVHFRFLVVNRFSDEIVSIENEIRHLNVGSSPIFVEVTFNHARFAVCQGINQAQPTMKWNNTYRPINNHYNLGQPKSVQMSMTSSMRSMNGLYV